MKYLNGMDVQEGDVIKVRHQTQVDGVVLKVLLPGSKEAEDWAVPEGGVLMECLGLEVSSREDFEADEDITFVCRGKG